MLVPDVLIPARNEEATIAAVIEAARNSGCVGNIIVISDGSSDATVRAARFADLVLSTDAGDKGSAIAHGLRWVTSELVLMLDADLGGLHGDHVAALASWLPVEAQIVGLRGDKRWAGSLPSLSGERRVPTALLRAVRPAGSGWTLETRLNAAVGRLGLPWRHLHLAGVQNPSKALSNPLGLAREIVEVAASSIWHAPALLAYTAHPDGH